MYAIRSCPTVFVDLSLHLYPVDVNSPGDQWVASRHESSNITATVNVSNLSTGKWSRRVHIALERVARGSCVVPVWGLVPGLRTTGHENSRNNKCCVVLFYSTIVFDYNSLQVVTTGYVTLG